MVKKSEEKLKEDSRKYSIKDGIFATIKDSVAGNFISPFAIALNASDALIAMLSSIPGLLGPISQWRSSDLIEKYPRKKIVLTSVFFEILAWLPLIAIALLFYFNIITSLLPLLLLVFFSLYVISSNAGGPAWFSWAGDIVDEEHRGRWFAKRTFILGIVSLVCSVASALLLDFLKKQDFLLFGFMGLFFIAFISRIISWYFLKKQYEPKFVMEKEAYFSFFDFIRKAPFNNFGRFAIFRSLLNCATYIAGPFFTIYMLRNLNFSYITWIGILAASTIFQLMFIRAWGRFSDKYGNYLVFKITIVLIVLCPLAWIVSGSPLYLILVPQLLSGIGWGGFNLACSNYVFDCVTPQKRCLAYSYYELVNGIGIFIGAGIGAILIENIKTTSIHPILVIFIISGILRAVVGIIMLPKLKEVRHTKRFTGRDLKSIVKKIEYPIVKEVNFFRHYVLYPLFFVAHK